MRVSCSALMTVVLIALAVRPATAEITAEEVRSAIDKGTEYLIREQGPRGDWSDDAGHPGGVTSLCTLALLNAGIEKDHRTIEKALASIRKQTPRTTYTVALQTMVLATADPKRDMNIITRNVRWLEQNQLKAGNRSGAWSYGGKGTGDNSNSQFAVLALHEAQRVGAPVNRATWQRALDYWKRTQLVDGSWGYIAGADRGYGSMTCAGIAGLVITSMRLNEGDAKVEGDQVNCCLRQQDNDELESAIDWMARNFSVDRNPKLKFWVYYYLYGMERVGRLTNRRFIGDHDWYREGAEKLIAEQDNLTGFWKGVGLGESHPHVGTSMALLFLSKGRRPVVIAKLKHPPGDDWNNHRRDLANLVAYTERKWERPLTWQVFDSTRAKEDPDRPLVEDLLQSPILLISGSMAPQFTEQQVRSLRDYIDRGGFIFGVQCCGNEKFDAAFRQFMDRIFPEPEYQLDPLIPPTHPIWRAEEPVNLNYAFPLYGIDYGCRTCVVYCPEDLTCYWELGTADLVEQDYPKDVQGRIDAAYAMGINVLTYATNREPRYKDELQQRIVEEGKQKATERGTLYIAKLKHPGGCNAAPGALINLLRTAAAELEAPISTEDRQIPITDESLFRYHMVFMHGRNQFRLTPGERKAIKQYVERGGTILADAICASPDFAASFRKEMKIIFPERQMQQIPAGDPLLTQEYGGYDIRQVERRDPSPRVKGQPLRASVRTVAPELETIVVEGRYGVLFSPYDISCALEKHESLECNGYLRQDAARIGLNVLLYTLHY